jgi:hypothetical protein
MIARQHKQKAALVSFNPSVKSSAREWQVTMATLPTQMVHQQRDMLEEDRRKQTEQSLATIYVVKSSKLPNLNWSNKIVIFLSTLAQIVFMKLTQEGC